MIHTSYIVRTDIYLYIYLNSGCDYFRSRSAYDLSASDKLDTSVSNKNMKVFNNCCDSFDVDAFFDGVFLLKVQKWGWHNAFQVIGGVISGVA